MTEPPPLPGHEPPPLPPFNPPPLAGRAPPAFAPDVPDAGAAPPTKLLIAAGALLVVAIIATAATLMLKGRSRRSAPVDPAALRQQAVAAFSATAPAGGATAAAADASEHRAAVESLVRNFRDVVGGKGNLRAADVFDSERLLDEVAQHSPPVRRMGARDRADFVRAFEGGFTSQLGKQPVFQWDKCDVKRVAAHPVASKELVLYLRARLAAGVDAKLRWWLHRRDGRWRVYDFEDLDGGVRVSRLIATVVTPGGDVAPWSSAMPNLQQAVAAIQSGNVDDAEKALRRLDAVQLPPEIDALRHVAWCSVHLGRGEHEKALATCDRAAALSPGMPVVDFQRAVAMNRLARYEEALAAARRYAELLGADADLAVEMGAAFEGLGRSDEALRAYRAGLDDGPDSAENFAGVVRLAPAEGRREEIAARFAQATARQQLFYTAAVGVDGPASVDPLDDLVRAYRAYSADDPWVDYYGAMVLSYRGANDRAFTLLTDVVKRLPDDQRGQAVPAMLRAGVEAGKPLDAYRAAPDATGAFRLLASQLGRSETVAQLRALMGAHRQRAPGDPWLAFYEGRERQLSGDRAAADAAFARAMAGPDEDVRQIARTARVLSRYEGGDVLGAYRDIPPREETFAALAGMCVAGARVEDLERLVGLHRASGGLSDAELVWWDGQSRWARKDYAAAADRFVRYARKLAKDRQRYEVDDSLVRACARAGRWDDALAHLRGRDADQVDPLHRAIAQAGAGNVDETLRAVAACLAFDYVIEDLYADDDLGPLLRADAMRGVRAKHPEATTQPATAPSSPPR